MSEFGSAGKALLGQSASRNYGAINGFISTQNGANLSSGVWCGDFTAAVMRSEGFGTPSAYKSAQAWLNYGEPVSGGFKVGDVAVWTPRNTGMSHVGVVTGIDSRGRPIVLQGNTSNSVRELSENPDKLVFRRPTDSEGKTPAEGGGKGSAKGDEREGSGKGNTDKNEENDQKANSKGPLSKNDHDDVKGEAGNYSKSSTRSTVSRLPSHEPWSGHPKSKKGDRKGVDGGGGSTPDQSSAGGGNTGSSGGGGGSGSGGGGGGTGNGGASSITQVGPTTSSPPSTAEVRLAAYTATLESTGLQNQSDVFQSMLNRAGQNYSRYGGLGNQITARGQYAPISSAVYGSSGGDANSDRAYGGVNAGKQELLRLAGQDNGLQLLQQRFGGKGNPAAAAKVIEDHQSNGPLSQSSQSFIGGRTDFRGYSGVTAGEISRGDRGANSFRAANANKGASKYTDMYKDEKKKKDEAVEETGDPGPNKKVKGAEDDKKDSSNSKSDSGSTNSKGGGASSGGSTPSSGGGTSTTPSSGGGSGPTGFASPSARA